jgi:hypothetical protein
MSNATAIIAASLATVPALVVGSIVGGLAGSVTGIATGCVASACGAEDETAGTAADVAGTVTYYGLGGYTAFKIVQGVYNAFDE